MQNYSKNLLNALNKSDPSGFTTKKRFLDTLHSCGMESS